MGRIITYFGLFIAIAPWVWVLLVEFYARLTYSTGETMDAAVTMGVRLGIISMIPGLIIATVGVVVAVLEMIREARRKRA